MRPKLPALPQAFTPSQPTRRAARTRVPTESPNSLTSAVIPNHRATSPLMSMEITAAKNMQRSLTGSRMAPRSVA